MPWALPALVGSFPTRSGRAADLADAILVLAARHRNQNNCTPFRRAISRTRVTSLAAGGDISNAGR